MRTGARPDLLFDAVAQAIVKSEARLQDHEQHDAHVVIPVLVNDDALLHLLQQLDLPVDFGSADAHPARIEGGVGATVDHHAAMLCPLGEIADASDIRPQFVPAQLPLDLVLAPKHQRRPGASLAQQILRKAKMRFRKELCAGHLAFVDQIGGLPLSPNTLVKSQRPDQNSAGAWVE
jgi:hypothetical protein